MSAKATKLTTTEKPTTEKPTTEKATKLTNEKPTIEKTTTEKPTIKKETAEKNEKAKAELKRYEQGIKTLCKKPYKYIGDFAEINARSFNEKCGHYMSLYILEAIDTIQKNEVRSAESHNSYPADVYSLLADKINDKVAPAKQKRAINERSTATKKKTAPKKFAEDSNSEAEDSDEEEEQPDDAEQKDEPETKTANKKNVMQINRNGKSLLGFIANRFLFEIYSTDIKSFKNEDDFIAVLNSIPELITTQISRTIIPTVTKMRANIDHIEDRGFTNYFNSKILADTGNKNTSYGEFIAKYTSYYFRLIAQVLANQLWEYKRGSINADSIRFAMRDLDGKIEHIDFGISNGMSDIMRRYDTVLNPPLTEEEKKVRNRGRGKPAASSTASVTNTTTKDDDDEDEEEEGDEESDNSEEESDEDTKPPTKAKPTKTTNDKPKTDDKPKPRLIAK